VRDEEEHTLAINDPARAYSQGGVFFLICSCGEKFGANSVEAVTRKAVDHIDSKK
jgi:hypothetical protein